MPSEITSIRFLDAEGDREYHVSGQAADPMRIERDGKRCYNLTWRDGVVLNIRPGFPVVETIRRTNNGKS